ncbi:unnamed protein product [Hydatigera taeniaeformis]|uniref:Aldo_ket_red domain-containing protein n=1 Tax=Hydatigena taeniaeformis TaxID=6205 RepID=A0A0R3WRH8_HYDTA|nr:unnamed protein product [Hydatigera taeniaeformis]
MLVPSLKLSGFSIPCIGFGTYKVLRYSRATAGYRHIDCAHLYQNEEAIGGVLESWIDDGKLKREDLFITSKVPDMVKSACLKTLERLKLSYLDLYLIHWTIFDDVKIEVTWKNLVKDGLVLHIGLSNFNESQVQRIVDCASIKPVMLQIESNPHFPNQKLIDFSRSRGILSTGFAPLGSPYLEVIWSSRQLHSMPHRLIDEPVLTKIGEKYGKTTAQVALRHGIQRGICVVPKSQTPKRIKENFQVFDFELTDDEMKEINALGLYQRQVRANP